MEQISEGIYFCIENATNIFGDAYILIKANRFPRALSLLLLAIQEAGKVNILKNMVKMAESEVIKILYKLQMEKEIGFFSAKALKIYREEFNNFHPEIEFGKEYEIEDFGNRFFWIKRTI